jgi:hypothetical protein
LTVKQKGQEGDVQQWKKPMEVKADVDESYVGSKDERAVGRKEVRKQIIGRVWGRNKEMFPAFSDI